MNFFSGLFPRPRPFPVLLRPCSPQVGKDQQPARGADMGRHWTRHRGPTMHEASRSHADGASATVGLGVPEVPGGGQPTPQPYPFVPLPLVRPSQDVAAEPEVRPAPCSAPVPSPRPEPDPRSEVIEPLPLVSSLSRRCRTGVRSLARRNPAQGRPCGRPSSRRQRPGGHRGTVSPSAPGRRWPIRGRERLTRSTPIRAARPATTT
jgi:hypothetical protein